MRWVLIGGTLLLGLLAGVAGAADGPLADAGLDQSVTQGATVYLDAGGSTAPDGEITTYEWTIERPNGTETTPECSSCVRTSFVADQPGTYAVTVEVTDDYGATDRDTLYVDVSARAMPEAALEGPTTLTVGEAGTFVLDGEAGDSPLSSHSWLIDNEQRGTEKWNSTAERSFSFSEPGEYTITGVITDTAGYQDQVNHSVSVKLDNGTKSNINPTQKTGPNSDSGDETTYDRLFVGDDGKLYAAVGNEILGQDIFRMYLPNGEKLVISTERISNSPGPMSDNPLSMIDDSAIGFENGVAQLKYVQDVIAYTEYDLDELKQMMPKTDCQLSGHEAQRCVEQNLVGLSEEAKKEQGKRFTNIGPTWTEKEFEGHPDLGPNDTRASNTENNRLPEELIDPPHPSGDSDGVNSESTSHGDDSRITSPDDLVPPNTGSSPESNIAGQQTDGSSNINTISGSPSGGHTGTGRNRGDSRELTVM